jgi:hypothetical protein
MRGEVHPIGGERVAKNGYHYIKVETVNGGSEWKLKHHLVAERTLGRKIDTAVERVFFKDTNKENFDPDNIVVEPKKGMTREARKARLQSRIEELQGQLEDLEEEAS